MAVETRDKDSEIGRKYGNILVGRLRNSYGSGFAPGCADDDKLSDILAEVASRTNSMRHVKCAGRRRIGAVGLMAGAL